MDRLMERYEQEQRQAAVGREKEAIELALAEIDRLRADFVNYANHKPDCRGGDGEQCACGYLQAWSRVNTVSTNPKEVE